MTAVTEQVAASADDRQHTTETDMSSSVSHSLESASATTMKFGYQAVNEMEMASGFVWTNYMRFTSVAIPQGATIDDAKIQIYATAHSSAGSKSIVIDGNDVDDAAQASSEGDIRSATKTSATVTWTLGGSPSTGAWVDSPEIKTIIKEIVDRGSWSSGNDINLYFRGPATSADWSYTFRTYDYSGNAHGPKLVLNYSTSSAAKIPVALFINGMCT